MTTALVTGSHGFVGTHLRATLRERGWHVTGLDQLEAEAAPGEAYVCADVTNSDAMVEIIDAVRPDVVFHLAAATPQRTPDPAVLVASAVGGTQAVCGALRQIGVSATLVLAGSSAEYGPTRPGFRTTELTPCRPGTPYGQAKLAAELIARALAEGASFHLVLSRAFNHVGPNESPATVAGSLARRVAAVREGRADRVRVSDMASIRDFTDVRDIAAGYVALAEHGTSGGVYNLCSGRAREIASVLDILLAAADLNRSVVDEEPTVTATTQVGSPRLTFKTTGWSAAIPLETSLGELMRFVLAGNGSGWDVSKEGDGGR